MTDRAQFEAWISRPPFEHMCDRFPEGMNYAGQYRRYETQMAWEAWQAARAWRTIAEAPKDGTVIIVAGGSFHCDEVGYEISGLPLRGFEFAEWCEYEKRFCDPENTFRFFTPTHFQALPPLPEPTASG